MLSGVAFKDAAFGLAVARSVVSGLIDPIWPHNMSV